MKRVVWMLVAAAFAWGSQSARSEEQAKPAPPSPPRDTFSWPLGQPDAPQPRGGTTRGAPVTLATEPSEAWRALQQPGLSALERDRRAILAMAGEYRVTFDFLEIESYKPDGSRDRPYQSWGTEKVYVERDDGNAISLVHMLEMRIVQNDGSISEPMVTKHWRQDWQYEPRHLVEFKGHDRWQRRELAKEQRAGRWSQTVYQVDESPRYASVGRWEHSPSFSTWLSGDTWRPLPRREWSVRDDYHALVGSNRHTITATGWLQEENNLKAVLTEQRTPDLQRPYLAREYGAARYERIRGQEFSAADDYYQRTRAFWNEVHERWRQIFTKHGEVTLRGPVDKLGLFMPLFAHADQIAQGAPGAEGKSAAAIDSALREMGVAL